ncbi:YheC/YheD family protein [Halalkalibacter flavus]|uniref:YheC/YheD family protein n=1 Tax=Halalkalibacter flavus TaxID=3090668 RepID=UPI002FC677D4
MIGIILSTSITKRVSVKDEGNWDPYIQFYTKQARKHQVDLCFYSLKDISVKSKQVNGFVYSYKHHKLVKKQAPLPKINLYKVKAYLTNKKAIEKVKRLKEDGFIIFNACSKREHRDKYKSYKYLSTFSHIRPHLPETTTLSYENLSNMLNKYPEVFIKPKRGGQGNKISIIRKEGNGYQIVYVYKRTKKEGKISNNQLRDFYKRKFPSPSKFIVQQGIPLKTYKGNKFDFRASPQKNKLDRWQVTGVMARIATRGWDVTNIDQGGKSFYKLSKLINPQTKKKIKRLNIQIAKVLEKRFPHLNDLGLDFAVDKNGKIWFLEDNFVPNRKKANQRRNRIPFANVCSLYKKQ